VALAAFFPPFLPNRRWSGGAPTWVLVRPAGQAHSVRTVQSSLLPLPVLPVRCFPADSLLPGHNPAQEARWPGGGETGHATSTPIFGDDHLGCAFTDPRDRRQQLGVDHERAGILTSRQRLRC
jgi:hypothetical protein